MRTKRFDSAEVMHGDGYVAVLVRVPCSRGATCGCYEAKRALTLSPAAARGLAVDLERGARWAEDRP